MKDYDTIPVQTMGALKRYREKRIPTGDFLRCVLTNDLFGAMSRGDDPNIAALHLIVKYIYNEMPGICWGNQGIVEDWLSGN